MAKGAADLKLDWRALEKRGLIVPNKGRSRIQEQFRHIKRPLLNRIARHANEPKARANVIMVTSALPMEGKTFTAANLALSIAMEQDRRVLLVDGDAVNPNVGRTLGADLGGPGLVDYLKGEVRELADILYRTDLEGFGLMPAGRPDHLSFELLASQAMHRLVAELASRYSDRVIVVDSPPLLGANEPKILGQMAGQIVAVVEELRTPQTALQEALSSIETDAYIGLVLNKSRRRLAQYYGYYYGQGG